MYSICPHTALGYGGRVAVLEEERGAVFLWDLPYHGLFRCADVC